MTMQSQPRGTVVVLASYAPSLIVFRSTLISALVARGYRVVGMAPGMDPLTRQRVEALGAETEEAPIDPHGLNPLGMAKTVRALQRSFERLKPEAVIAYTVKPVTLGAIAARRAGVSKFVSMITGLGYAFGEGPGMKRKLILGGVSLLYGYALRHSRTIIFQNGDDRDLLRRRRILPASAHSIVVGGSGIDLEQFSPAPLPERPAFLMIARLIREKGVREFGEAAAVLKRKYPDTAFRLAGFFDTSPDAITREELAQMERNGVEFLGKLDDVRPAIAAASAVVLPSYFREGVPRSLLEALAMGRAIVTTDRPGCRETVREGVNGHLVPSRDAGALAGAMERLITQPDRVREMGAESRALAEQRFEVNLVTTQMLDAAGL